MLPQPPNDLIGLGILPEDSVVPLGGRIQFSATGYYEDSTTVDMTDIVHWQSWQPSIFGIANGMDHEGEGMGLELGQSRIRAVYRDLVSNELRVKVTSAELQNLNLSPSELVVRVGESAQLGAEAVFSDGTHGTVSGTVHWIAEDPFIATVGPTGQVEAHIEGNTTIRATYDLDGEVLEVPGVPVTVLPESMPIQPADLRVANAWVEASEDSVTWTVEVENEGQMAASSFWVDVWQDRSSAPMVPSNGDTYQVVSHLAPGERSQVVITLNNPAPGDFSSWVLVDSLDVIDEANEGDNLYGPVDGHVSDGNDLPPFDGGDGGPDGGDEPDPLEADLAISWLDVWTFSAPDEVYYLVDVTNLGDLVSEPGTLGVFTDPGFLPSVPSVPDADVPVAALEPGETAYLSVVVTELPEVSWQSWVVVDPEGLIQESDESNNSEGVEVLP